MKPSILQQVERDPDAAARRLMRTAHNRDGLPEIAIGAILLTGAFLIWLEVAFRPGSFAYRTAALGMALLVAPMIGAAPWAIKWVRRQFLMDREGYVELKPVPRKRTILAIGTALVVAIAMTACVVFFGGSLPPSSWMVAGTGILWGLLAVYAGRLPRYVVGGVLMAAMGIALGFSRVSFQIGSLILYGSMGALSLVSGCVVLLRFISTPKEEAD